MIAYTYTTPAQLPGGFIRVGNNTRPLMPEMTTYRPPQFIDQRKAEYFNTLNNVDIEKDIPQAVHSTGRVRRLPTWSNVDEWWMGDTMTNQANMYPDPDPTMTAGYNAAYIDNTSQWLYPALEMAYADGITIQQ